MKLKFRTSKEYELYVPLHFNDGRRVPPVMLKRLKHRLVNQFGGLTEFRHKQEGVWRIGTVLFRDQIVVLRVLSTEPPRKARSFWKEITTTLKKQWKQKDVLLVVKKVQTT